MPPKRRLFSAPPVSGEIDAQLAFGGFLRTTPLFFLNFSYVCPEPVLVKRSFIYINGSKRAVFAPREGDQIVRAHLIDRSLFFEFSLCLSRACLGKMFVLIYKWLKKTVFTHLDATVGLCVVDARLRKTRLSFLSAFSLSVPSLSWQNDHF
jgi:hypothetical protein